MQARESSEVVSCQLVERLERYVRPCRGANERGDAVQIRAGKERRSIPIRGKGLLGANAPSKHGIRALEHSVVGRIPLKVLISGEPGVMQLDMGWNESFAQIMLERVVLRLLQYNNTQIRGTHTRQEERR